MEQCPTWVLLDQGVVRTPRKVDVKISIEDPSMTGDVPLAPGVHDELAVSTASRPAVPEGEIGYFGDVTLVSAHNITLDVWDLKKPPPYGLKHLYHAVAAVVMDDDGAAYYLMRVNHLNLTPRLLATKTFGWEPATDIPQARDCFYGYTTNGVADDLFTLRSRGKPDRSMRYQLEPGVGATWQEKDFLDLEFRCLGAGVAFFHPDPVCDLYYTGENYSVSGEILGVPVRGIGNFEQGWGSNGALEYLETPIPKRVESQWIMSFTEYADGTVEHMDGVTTSDGNRGGGVFGVNGDSRALRGIKSEFRLGDAGLPVAMSWSSGDLSRELDLVTGSMTSPRNPSFCWQVGKEPSTNGRKVLYSIAIVETLPRALAQAGSGWRA